MAAGFGPAITDGHHTVFLMDRGGKRRIKQLYNASSIVWGRTRDAISTATIKITANNADPQADVLNEMEPGRHEICIFDENDDRAWEGPIGLPTFNKDGVEIGANDVLYYLHRTIMKQGYSSAYPAVAYATDHIAAVLTAELAVKESLSPPVNILPYLVNHRFSIADAMTSRVSLPYQSLVDAELDYFAQNGGIDYTAVGRAIHLWDTSNPVFGQTATATENDFLADVDVSVYGSELATGTAVTDGQGNFAYVGAVDPFYGEWETLASPYDPTTGAAPPSQADMLSQAERDLAGRNPTPLQVRIPDGSAINPAGVLQISQLIPGIYIPLRATLSIRKITQMQKLKSMQVSETSTGTVTTVTMYPASTPDLTED